MEIGLWDHPFSTYANFPKNEHFLSPGTHTYMCVSVGKNVSFSENFEYALHGWTLSIYADALDSKLEVPRMFLKKFHPRVSVAVQMKIVIKEFTKARPLYVDQL